MKKILLFSLGFFCLAACNKVADVIAPVQEVKTVEITAISPYAVQLGLNSYIQYKIYARVITLDGQDTGEGIKWSNSDGYCEIYNSASGTWGSTGTSAHESYIKIRSTAATLNKISSDGFCQFNLHTNVYPDIVQIFVWN